MNAQIGSGGTAPVFEVTSPEGPRALKIYDERFSTGDLGTVERKRIDQQLLLKGHECPSLVQAYEGGEFAGRLYLVMSRAPGSELEKRLRDIPRDKIRGIVHQVAEAALFLKEKGLCHRDIKGANVFVSDTFDHATLLDISVIRDVHDPVGVGTDHEGQLPVVATARYSPPEYLFRLIDPGLALWHALTIYQLGALLHDLIMRTPLFQVEYERCSTNRYRFAWIVSTELPKVDAADVDRDLLFLARRALDKDWERRSTLKVEDFLADSAAVQKNAFRLLGFKAYADEPKDQVENIATLLERVRNVSSAVEGELIRYLRKQGITPTHQVMPGPTDTCQTVLLKWDIPADGAAATPGGTVEFRLTIDLVRARELSFGSSASLTSRSGAVEHAADLKIPPLPDGPGIESLLAEQAQSLLEKLAVEVTRASNSACEA